MREPNNALQWIAIPKGFSDPGRSKLRVTAMAAFSLRDVPIHEEVGTYASGVLRNWPSTLRKYLDGFVFSLWRNGQKIGNEIVISEQHNQASFGAAIRRMNGNVWGQVFPPSMRISDKAYTSVSSAPRVFSYSGATIEEVCAGLHTTGLAALIPSVGKAMGLRDPSKNARALTITEFSAGQTGLLASPRTQAERIAAAGRLIGGSILDLAMIFTAPAGLGSSLRDATVLQDSGKLFLAGLNLIALPDRTTDRAGHEAVNILRERDPLERAKLAANNLVREAINFIVCTKQEQSGKNKEKAAIPPLHDFNRQLASLTALPMLYVPLGIVFDFEVELPRSWNTRANDQDSIQIEVAWKRTALEDNGPPKWLIEYSEWSRTLLSSNYFPLPAASSEWLEGGILRIGATTATPRHAIVGAKKREFFLCSTDPHASCEKLIMYAKKVYSSLPEISPSITVDTSGEVEDAEELLPFVQGTTGISLFESNRRAALQDKLNMLEKARRAYTSNTGADKEFYLNTLVIGLRPDAKGTRDVDWRSLVDRVTEFPVSLRTGDEQAQETFPGVFRRGEGIVREFVRKHDASTVVAEEELFRWNGWSLAAPFPDARVTATRQSLDAEFASARKENPFALVERHKARGLPRLRYGTEYWIRCRCALIDGTSLVSVNEADAMARSAGASGESQVGSRTSADTGFYFRRWEPVKAPQVLLAHSIDRGRFPGESARVVIARARSGKAAAESSSCVRYVVPQRISFDDASRHGVFDAGAKPWTGAFEGIRLEDDGTFPHGPAPTGSATTGAGGPTSDKFDGNSSSERECVFEKSMFGRRPKYPYYPDPLARWIVVRLGYKKKRYANSFAPIVGPDAVKFFRTYDSWPKVDALRLELSPTNEPTVAPHLEWRDTVFSSDRTLCVVVPKGERVTVRLSCVPLSRDEIRSLSDPNDVAKIDRGFDSLELYVRILDSLAEEGLRREFRSLTVEGQNWSVSPFTDVDFIHAVDTPVLVPRIEKLTSLMQNPVVEKCDEIGGTTGSCSNTIEEGPIARAPGATNQQLKLAAVYHAQSTGQLDLNGSWPEPIDEPRLGPPRIDAQSGAKVFSWLPETFETRSQPVIIDHEFGDTKHRAVDYRLVAGSRFKELYGITNESLNCFCNESKPVSINIPSSAVPPSPTIRFVIPTIEYAAKMEHSAVQSTRRSGLRVYVERPWFRTGSGEQLAVILPAKNGKFEDVWSSHGGVASFWGQDPIWDSRMKTQFIQPQHFGQHGHRLCKRICLPESKLEVLVMPFDVTFEREKDVWFADIGFNESDSYFPFVRLALARYQRNAEPGKELSSIVLADFMQLLPGRTATIKYDSRDERRLDIEILGVPSEDGNIPASLEVQTRMLIQVEELCEGFKNDDDFGWVTGKSELGEDLIWELELEGRRKADRYWRGKVVLPESYRKRMYRLVIREQEIGLSDIEASGKRRTNFRDTYVDIIPLAGHPSGFA
jgi:hypothetical protein